MFFPEEKLTDTPQYLTYYSLSSTSSVGTESNDKNLHPDGSESDFFLIDQQLAANFKQKILFAHHLQIYVLLKMKMRPMT